MTKSKWLVVVALLAVRSLPANDAVPRAKPDAVRGEEIAGLKWGMFICWSMASAINAPSEWVRSPVEPKQFTATDCDTDQWCQTAKEAGMGYILFLTKHHDGFCLWETKTTTLNVMNSPLKRDVLAALRKSCDKHGIKLALYFSEGDWPMDRKKASAAEQAALKKAQLKELLTLYGPVEFIWFDRAAGTGGLEHLDTDKWVRQFQLDCFSGFNHGQPAGRISLRERGTPGPLGQATAMGNQMENEKKVAFSAAEFTYPINQKYWFFNVANPEHPNVPAAKIYADYCGAVKHGNIFSLDVGPNLEGKLRDMDVQTLRQVGEMIKNPPPMPVSQGKPAKASGVWGTGHEAGKAFDGDEVSRWGADKDARSGWLEVDLEKETQIGHAVVAEIGFPRTQEFVIEYKAGDTWKQLHRGTAIDGRQFYNFPAVNARYVRLNILQANDVPTIEEFQLYAPK